MMPYNGGRYISVQRAEERRNATMHTRTRLTEPFIMVESREVSIGRVLCQVQFKLCQLSRADAPPHVHAPTPHAVP